MRANGSTMDKGKFENQTYYDLLGIERTASIEEIKRAYKELAWKHHPDAGGIQTTEIEELEDEDLSKTRAFKILTFAYNTLKDPELREEYDRSLPPLPGAWGDPVKDEVGEKLRQFQRNGTEGFGFGQVPTSFDDDDDEVAFDGAQEYVVPEQAPIRKRKGLLERLLALLT